MADVIIARTVELTVGLREGGADAEHEVLATYRDRAGIDVFALCRHGMLLRDGSGWRFIDSCTIDTVRLPREVKSSIAGRRLVLTLKDGSLVDVPVDGERDGGLHVFAIHAFVRRRVHQQRR